jgi:hypothetical protein
MSGTLLVTRPKHDDTTHYLFHWAQEIIRFAKQKGIKILDLDRERANKEELESVVAKMRPSFIFFNGHGGMDHIAGYDNRILIQAGDNEKVLKAKSVYALSCSSAKKLGPASIDAGANVYLGYDDVFIFSYEPGKLSNPCDDKTAELFLGPSNQLVISILKGHSAGESYERSQKCFLQNIQKIATNQIADLGLIPYLLWNKMHQVCLGDKEAVL